MIVNITSRVDEWRDAWYYASVALPGHADTLVLAFLSPLNGTRRRVPNGAWVAVGDGLRMGFDPSRLPHPDSVPRATPYSVDSNTGLVSPRHAE